jgi:hypothetical protein
VTAKDLALLLLQAPVGLEVELNGKSIRSIAVFGGVLNLDSDDISLEDAEIVFFDARDAPQKARSPSSPRCDRAVKQ